MLNRLPEYAVLIAQAVAHRRKLQRCHRIQKTGRQSPQPAIPEPRVRLLLQDAQPIQSSFFSRSCDAWFLPQIGDVVCERPPQQKLHREVINPLRVFLLIHFFRTQPAMCQYVTHGVRERLKSLTRRRFR